MARRTAGLRERVYRALMVSAGIFAVSLAYWGVQTLQLSEATSTGTPPFTVTPNTGVAPLTVTASYSGSSGSDGTTTGTTTGPETFESTATGQLPDGWINQSGALTQVNGEWTGQNGNGVSVGVAATAGNPNNGLHFVDTDGTAASRGNTHYAGTKTNFTAASQGSVSLDIRPGQNADPSHQFGIAIGGAQSQFIYVYLSQRNGSQPDIQYYCDTTAGCAASGYYDLGGSYTAGQWSNLKIVWDSAAKTFDVYLNGAKLNAQPIGYSYPNNAGPATFFQLFSGYECCTDTSPTPSQLHGFTGTYDVDNVSYPGHEGAGNSGAKTTGPETFESTAADQLPSGWINQSGVLTKASGEWTGQNGNGVSVGVTATAGNPANGLHLVDTDGTAASTTNTHYAGTKTNFASTNQGSLSLDIRPGQAAGLDHQFGLAIGGAQSQFIYVYLSQRGGSQPDIQYWCDTGCSGASGYYDLGGSYTAGQWSNLKVTWDSTAKTFDVYLNATKLNSQPIKYSYPNNAAPATFFQLFTGYECCTDTSPTPSQLHGFTGTYDVDNVSYPGHEGNAGANLTWDFGDGTVITNGPNTQTHTYTSAGTYTVSLKVDGVLAGTQTVTVTAPQVIIQDGAKGSVNVNPTTGTAPLTVSLTCSGDKIANLLVEWGDGQSTDNVTCPTTLNHTYTDAGDFTISIKQAGTVLLTQKVSVTRAADGKSAPRKLASTGANLLLVLLIAAVLSGAVSYFIIRRPFHGDE